MVTDVVCGMQVDAQRAQSKGLTVDHAGKTYAFCSPGCKQQFEQHPERFIGSADEQRG